MWYWLEVSGLPFHGYWFAASLEFSTLPCFSQQVSHYERIFPESHDAIKAVYEIIGESSATKAVEGYKPFRPGDITVPSTSTPKRNKLARRNATFFTDDSDDDEEEISISRGDLKKIFAKLTTADRLDRLMGFLSLYHSWFSCFTTVIWLQGTPLYFAIGGN